jgi:hypothetical protein
VKTNEHTGYIFVSNTKLITRNQHTAPQQQFKTATKQTHPQQQPQKQQSTNKHMTLKNNAAKKAPTQQQAVARPNTTTYG